MEESEFESEDRNSETGLKRFESKGSGFGASGDTEGEGEWDEANSGGDLGWREAALRLTAELDSPVELDWVASLLLSFAFSACDSLSCFANSSRSFGSTASRAACLINASIPLYVDASSSTSLILTSRSFTNNACVVFSALDTLHTKI